jgi:putative peptide zinc metalloprotease protein
VTPVAPAPAPAPDLAWPPRLASGTELLGEFKNSGTTEPPSLVRRADGQVIQLSRLLYLVASLLDGSRGPDVIAAKATAELGRALSAEQVGYLITAKLAPLGIVASVGAPVALPTARPLLALRARATLLPAAAAGAAGAFLRPLFSWPVIVAVIGGTAALDYWILSVRGLVAGLQQLLNDPVDLLLVAALTVASALFHECGHAAGCRRGGATPGRIGFGIYLVWPAFFTNVTDSYRLSRAGRLRTDLGGIYFNLIFILGLAGVYAATNAKLLLLVIALTHLEMLEQLLPFVRFDGYFILSDLVGVPDLFARIAPVVRGSLLRQRDDPRVATLRAAARVIITAWVLIVIPLLLFTLGYLVLFLPAANRALWHSASQAGHLAATALAGHKYARSAASGVGAALAVVPIAGTLYIMAGLLRSAVALGRRWSAGRPRRRLAAAVIGIGCAASLAFFWFIEGQFRDW